MKNPASAGFFFAWVLSGLKGCSCKDRHSARDCVQSQNLLLPNHLSNHQHWLLLLERGDRQELPSRPRPLLEREPVKVWRTLALLSLLINLILLLTLLKG